MLQAPRAVCPELRCTDEHPHVDGSVVCSREPALCREDRSARSWCPASLHAGTLSLGPGEEDPGDGGSPSG